MRKLSLFVFLAFACFAVAVQGGVTLKREPKVGEMLAWRLSTDFQIYGESANYSSLITDKVIRVEPDGVYETETTQTEYKATFAGDAMDVADMPTHGTVYAPDGSIKELKGSITNEAAYRVANATLLRLPTKPVAVGESWTVTVPADKKTGVLAATYTYKVEAEEKIEDLDCLKCSITYKETEGGDPVTAEGFVWINKADGTMVNLKASWSNVPIPGAPSAISGQVIYTREKVSAN